MNNSLFTKLKINIKSGFFGVRYGKIIKKENKLNKYKIHDSDTPDVKMEVWAWGTA